MWSEWNERALLDAVPRVARGAKGVKVRLVSYNIHKCIGGIDRRYRPGRVRDVIAHYRPDLALLQEVANGQPRSNGDRQVDLLGEMVNLEHRTWFPNHQFFRGGEYGNAVLSRFPLVGAENIDVTIPPKKRRGILHARFRVRFPDGHTRTLHVFNLHLGLSGAERKIQLRRFLDDHPFAGIDREMPVIVAGDFNDVWGTLGRKLLAPRGFRGLAHPIHTFPAYAPVRALDSIYVRGDLRLVRAYRSRLEVATQASDHLPLVAELVIGE